MTTFQQASMSERNSYRLCISILSYLIILIQLCQKIDGYSLAKHMAVDQVEHSCPELDNCSYGNQTTLLPPTFERSCACDSECSKFEDCCIDASKSGGVKSNMKCFDVKGLGGVYMIGKCPPQYDGDERWRGLCENAEIPDLSDPMGSVPVTDPDTGVTYKNIYCELCNGKLYFMRFWSTKLDCPFLSSFNESYTINENYVLENLVKKDGIWGLNIETIDGTFFLECNIETVFPTDIRHRIRLCKTDLVSDCPASWENEIIRKKCKSFQGPRYTYEGEGYRNLYCAICNNINAAELSCISPQAESIKYFRFNLAHSFALLLDVNVKKGERVGMVRMCKPTEVYDPFFKKCRELQCLPGFVRRGRKCFPRRSVIKYNRKSSKTRREYITTTTEQHTNVSSTISSTSESSSEKTFGVDKEQSPSYYETGFYTTIVPPKNPVYMYDSSNKSTAEILYEK